MKLLLVVLALIVATVLAEQHCLDATFTAQTLLADPSKEYDDTHTIYFDSTVQKQRLDINVLEPIQKTETVLLRYDMGKMFVIDQKTGNCNTRPLAGKIEPFCVSTNATHVTQITLGGRLKCDVYEEQVGGFDVRVVITATNDIPVNIVSSGGHAGYVFQEWFNYERAIKDPSVFNVPKQCATQIAARSAESDARIEKLLAFANKIQRGVQKF